MHRSWILLIPLFAACGPSVDEPVEQSTGGSSGATTTADASTGPSSASGGIDTGSTSDVGSTSAAETGSVPDGMPPEMAGQWLCTGWEDPILIVLEVGPAMAWEGSACAPFAPDSGIEPACDAIGFGHPNFTNTQAYWIFELDYTPFGAGVLAVDMGMDHVPATDTLEGFIAIEGQGGFQAETCVRFER